jgi:hypothetical protein
MSDDEPTRAETDDELSTEMTDTTDDATTEEPASPEDPEADSDLRQKLNYALLAGLSLLALIAALQFYLNASSVINQWVTHEYRSLFQAAFNLAVLLVAAAGISRQVSRLTN